LLAGTTGLGKIGMASFKALRIDKADQGQTLQEVQFPEAELMEGDVTVRVTHSTVNYKDGLAITGKSPVVRRFPMIPGIDFAGVVETSDDPEFRPGDKVVLNGWGLGETHLGAYAERARVKGTWLIPLPSAFTPAQAMAIGTAGYTAMLCVIALERHGLGPAHGPAIVTGAAGGVGSVAVALLAKLGWHVIASTGRVEEAAFLKNLGAAEIVDRATLSAPGRPLGKELYGAGIDSVGSHTLANVLAQTKSLGAVAACGLAQGMDLPTSVAPFILRGVSLLGINSVTATRERRLEAWARLARDLDPAKLDALTTTVGFGEIVPIAQAILEGKVRGRVVVEIG
jgi:acrylyl-CoA reductase (NADPH)